MRVTDDQGNEYVVADDILTGNADEGVRAELARVREELARTQGAVTRLSSRPELQDEPEQTDDEAAMETFQAERAKGHPQDRAEAAYVRKIAERTMSRAEARNHAKKTVDTIDKIQAQLDALKGSA